MGPGYSDVGGDGVFRTRQRTDPGDGQEEHRSDGESDRRTRYRRFREYRAVRQEIPWTFYNVCRAVLQPSRRTGLSAVSSRTNRRGEEIRCSRSEGVEGAWSVFA